MEQEPYNFVLNLLREMRGLLDEHSAQLRWIENRLEILHETSITALGLAGRANIWHESVDKRLDELTGRVRRLETVN